MGANSGIGSGVGGVLTVFSQIHTCGLAAEAFVDVIPAIGSPSGGRCFGNVS